MSLIELRFNPMKRNLGGERDLDHIIHAALRGMDRACLEYGVRAGLIFCLAREFSLELNEILVKKAVKYKRRGVVGIDLAGPEIAHAGARRRGRRLPRSVRARARGGARHDRAHRRDRVHGGAGRAGGAQGAGAVAHRPRHRRRRAARRRSRKLVEIGHGARDLPELEPAHARGRRTSPSWARRCARSRRAGVRYTINTDGPYLLNTHLRREYQLLIDANILTDAEAERSVAVAHAATFIR